MKTRTMITAGLVAAVAIGGIAVTGATAADSAGTPTRAGEYGFNSLSTAPDVFDAPEWMPATARGIDLVVAADGTQTMTFISAAGDYPDCAVVESPETTATALEELGDAPLAAKTCDDGAWLLSTRGATTIAWTVG